MPDNVKQEKNEQVDEKKENVNNKGKLQEEIDYDGYRKEMNENTHKAVKKSLDDIIKNIGKEVEKEKIAEFKKENPELEKMSDEEIKNDSRFKEFILSEQGLEKVFNANKQRIKDLFYNRQEKLHELGGNRELDSKTEGKVGELYNTATSEKEKRVEELKSLDPNKDKDRIVKLKDEISRLDKVIEGIGTPDEKGHCKNGTIRGDLEQAFALNGEVREKAYNELVNIFGQKIVDKDQALRNTLLGKELNNMAKEVNNIGENSKNNRPQDLQEKENSLSDAVPAGATAKVVTDEMEEQGKDGKEISNGLDCLNKLGYEGAVLNSKNSRDLLTAFVNADNSTQIQILSDKDSQEKIFEAMKKANNSWSPVAAFKFNKTRRELLNLANGPMMRKALESVGKDVNHNNLDQLGTQFKSVLRDYQANRTKKQREIDALPDGDEKTKLQAELDEFDKEYGAVTGVNEFRNISNKELNRFRDRVVNKMSNLFTRNNMDQLALPTKQEAVAQEKREEQYNRARGIIEQDRDNGFRSTIQRNVNNLEEIEKSEVAREAKENKDLSKNYQKKDGPVK